ncbi:MAG TPA: hypothetical protein VMZ91_13525 [Candidatus Paceibacterota bacterium]|nr:hypothetical protein [Candidatus Paceibacterota bacterium]
MAYKIKSKKTKEKKTFAVKFKTIPEIRSKEEAREIAINYQMWASRGNLSYGEIAEHQKYFKTIGKKFGLIKEFKENAII